MDEDIVLRLRMSSEGLKIENKEEDEGPEQEVLSSTTVTAVHVRSPTAGGEWGAPALALSISTMYCLRLLAPPQLPTNRRNLGTKHAR